ncbi:MAG TPA: hypothetical protein VN802_12915 [Stellaceae bacterium]|nr:hypothetical protein [Stellaceae bacterium]
MPNFPCEFEIPDAWLGEAGIAGFTRTETAYRSSQDAVLVPLREIEPPYRKPALARDWRGFERARLISILKGIIAGAEIEPVPLLELPAGSFVVPTFVRPGPYDYQVRNGFHRFYASIAAGFEYLPAVIS